MLTLLCTPGEFSRHSRQTREAIADKGVDVRNRATFRVFKIERKMHGREDLHFLERVFQKLLINFTWYVRALARIPSPR